MKINRKLFLYFILILLFVFTVYFPITKTFYQQDEWMGYGLFLAKGTGLIIQSIGGGWGVIFGQGRILTNLLLFIFYKHWPLNVVSIAVFALVMHSLNVLLVFLLSRKIFKKDFPAFLGSLFFAVSSVAQSAISWPAASINTLPSTTFILLAIYSFFKYLELNNKKWIFISFVFLYVSLFFKETGIFLFLLFPVYAFYYKKQSLRDFLNVYWYFLSAVFLIVAYRIWEFKSDSGQVALFLTGSSKYFFDSIIVRSVLYPLTSFSLSLVPPETFLNFARYITNVYYPFIPEGQFVLIAQTVVLDLLAVVLSMVIGVIVLILLKFSDLKIRKHIVFWVIFLLASFLPYVIISKSYSYLESRYYYVANAAWAIIFAWVLNVSQKKIKKGLLQFSVLIAYLVFLFVHMNITRVGLDQLVKDSQARIEIVNQIKKIEPTLENNKNIFYITGDADFYLPGNKIPFQEGMGYTIMVLYYDSKKIPKEFIDESYLFEIGSQGFKEVGGYGFGYFSDMESLRNIFKEKKIEKTTIKAFYYNSKANTIEDITSQTITDL